MERAIITACSNKYFPSVINLLTSIKATYPLHPTIFVYDLGLLSNFRREIGLIENVKVLDMPHFCGHWRSCYTWKTYIFAHPMARLNFYLDAGCQVSKPLEEIFSIIEKDDILLVDQGKCFESIVPRSYKSFLDLGDKYDSFTTLDAGVIGFKNSFQITEIFKKIYNAACSGLTLGFSLKDKWRNKGKDSNIFVRDCEIFRHDLTLVNIFFRIYYYDNIVVQPLYFYAWIKDVLPDHGVCKIRLNYLFLENLKINSLHNKTKLLFVVNRAIIRFMILIKRFNYLIKRKLSIIKI